jgi:hypothetical protein
MGNCCQGGSELDSAEKSGRRSRKKCSKSPIKKGSCDLLSSSGSKSKKYAKYNGDEYYEPDFDQLLEYERAKLDTATATAPHHLIAKSNLYKSCNSAATTTLAQKQFMLQQSNFVNTTSMSRNNNPSLSTSGVLNAIQNIKSKLFVPEKLKNKVNNEKTKHL